MGTGASKGMDGGSHGGEEREESLDHAGGQLYVSLKMENIKLKGELIPHVYGSVPLVGSWDSSKAVNSIRVSPIFQLLFLSFLLLIFICFDNLNSFQWSANRRQCGNWASLCLLITV